MDSSTHRAKRRILVVADEAIDETVLHEAIASGSADSSVEVRVTAPALNSRLRHWTSDEDKARREAEGRLRRCLDLLAGAGVNASGVVGDADPVQAIADAAHDFAPDGVVIATQPRKRAHWLTRHVLERARSRFGFPVLQVVVDPIRGAEYAHQPIAPRARAPTRARAAGSRAP